jgi:hypothetical protein
VKESRERVRIVRYRKLVDAHRILRRLAALEEPLPSFTLVVVARRLPSPGGGAVALTIEASEAVLCNKRVECKQTPI